MLAGIEHINH